MSQAGILAIETLEKRETDLGTSPRVVRLIPRKAGSISFLYVAKTNLKAKKMSVRNLRKKIPNKKRPKASEILAYLVREHNKTSQTRKIRKIRTKKTNKKSRQEF